MTASTKINFEKKTRTTISRKNFKKSLKSLFSQSLINEEPKCPKFLNIMVIKNALNAVMLDN